MFGGRCAYVICRFSGWLQPSERNERSTSTTESFAAVKRGAERGHAEAILERIPAKGKKAAAASE